MLELEAESQAVEESEEEATEKEKAEAVSGDRGGEKEVENEGEKEGVQTKMHPKLTVGVIAMDAQGNVSIYTIYILHSVPCVFAPCSLLTAHCTI
jgi:isoaspartyl peptidase/L-asparaginase-like protein (Ntn-hydrolase superfamily)